MTFNFKNFIFTNLIIGFSIMFFVLIITPPKAHAFASCVAGSVGVSTITDSATKVPVADGTVAANTGFTKQKGCMLDSFAQSAAKVVLQSMTSSIVNWINSGFEGNPSFLTNPSGFFLDVADQVTGAFLANSGALSMLCSPFNLDIRLALALNSAQYTQKRYTCTLNTVIANVRRGPRVSVGVTTASNGATIGDLASGNVLSNSNQLNVNGRDISTIEGYLGGDFTQGGWQAFMEMTLVPQNNVYGSYLSAHSELLANVAKKESQVNSDLNRGGGFLSWEKCEVSKTYSPTSPEATGMRSPPSGMRIKRTADGKYQNADGGVTYVTCTTQTPGSVISSSLTKQLGASTDSIVNINDINQALTAIVDSAAAKLIQMTLSKGLYASSQKSGGATRSAIDDLNYQENVSQAAYIKKQVRNIDSDISATSKYLTLRKQAVDALESERNIYLTARACYASKPDQAKVDQINSIMVQKVNPALDTYQERYDTATSTLADNLETMRSVQARIDSATTAAEAIELGKDYSQAIQGTEQVNAQDILNAKTSLTKAQSTAKRFHTEAMEFQSACTATSTAP